MKYLRNYAKRAIVTMSTSSALAALSVAPASAQDVRDLRVIPEMPLPADAPPLPVTGLEAFGQLCDDWDEWDKPAPPSLISGLLGPRLNYVGTCGITVLALDTPEGIVLFDTGPREAADAVLASMATLHLDPADIRLILTSHEHFDHVGGVAYFQSLSGAPVAVLPTAAQALRTGETSADDPQAGMHDAMEPVANVIELAADQPITFGGVTIVPIATPGHTPGATSWQIEVCSTGLCQNYVYADSLSPIGRDDYRFSDHPEYVAAYRAGLQRLAAADCDIVLTPHPSASDMIDRALYGHFENGPSCTEYAASIEARLDARLAGEAAE